MIENIKTPLKRALQHPKETGALLLSAVAIAGPAIKPPTAQAEGSRQPSIFSKLAKQAERKITNFKPVEAATGTLTVSRKVHNAGPHHNKTVTVHDRISHPLVVRYRSQPKPIGFLPGPNQEDITNGDFAFGTMTVKDHKPIITFSPYNSHTMTLSYPETSTNEPDEGLTTERIVFYKGETGKYQNFNAPLLAEPDGTPADTALEPNGQPQKIGHLSTTSHP